MGAATVYTYDDQGRLTSVTSGAGAATFTRTGNAVTVTAAGKALYSVTGPESGTGTWVWTDSAGGKTTESLQESGNRTISLPDRTTITATAADHPSFGAQARYPTRTIVESPGRPTATITASLTVDGPIDSPSRVVRRIDNGSGATTVTWDRATRTLTSTSPQGRTSTAHIDEAGQTTTMSAPGMGDSLTERGGNGLPTAVSHGAVSAAMAWSPGTLTTTAAGADYITTFAADTSVSSVTDPLGRMISHDTIGNTVTTSLGAQVLSVVTADHSGMSSSYPNGNGAFDTYATTLSDDRSQITAGWAGGGTSTITLDQAGRPVRAADGKAVTTLAYDGDTGPIASINHRPLPDRGSGRPGRHEAGGDGPW